MHGGDLLENDSTFHTDLDRDLFSKLPLESQSSSLSSLVTLSSPGVAADSNGLFHGLGDHASNSFSIDGQPITDQQSKVFSNQLPSNSVQSIEVISGAPPAEYGGKTSLVIQVTTRSGQGVTKPTGSITTSYGTFGSATGAVDLSYGGKNWGNFIEVDGLNTGRFLDPPEFVVFHDKGNEQNVFDRIDRQLTAVGFDSSQPELQPFVVSDAERLRQSECAECGQRRSERESGLRQCRQYRSALEDRHLRYRADLYAHHWRQLGLQLRSLHPERSVTTTIRAAIRLPILGPESADPDHRPEPYAYQRRRAHGLSRM